MTRQDIVDRVALGLVRRMLSLSGQIRGKHYTNEPHAFVVTVRGEERRVTKLIGYEEAEALSPYWQSMAEAALEVVDGSQASVSPVRFLLESTACNKCHAIFPGDVPDPCPACRLISEVGKMIAEEGR